MAERYATQRSKPVRRRSLPRLSDPATTALAEHDEAQDDGHEPDATATFTAGAAARAGTASRSTSTMPRRAGATRQDRAPAGIARVSYDYVKRDLRRIAITAISMLVLLIVLNIILENLIH